MSDADAIAQLATQLGYDLLSPALTARLSRILSRADQALLVADVDGHAVGWLHMEISEYIEAEAFVVVAGLVVDRSHRRQGIGRMLMEEAEQWARNQGCSIVRLWSSAIRTSSHRFYEALGYTNIKTQYAFIKALDAEREGDLKRFVPRVDS